jgi:hypothetical protein
MAKYTKLDVHTFESRRMLTFDGLVSVMVQTNAYMAAQTSKAVNMSLTVRNWLFVGLRPLTKRPRMHIKKIKNLKNS